MSAEQRGGITINVKKGGTVYLAGNGGEPSARVRHAVDEIRRVAYSDDIIVGARAIEAESDATVAIREFVREHGQEIIESLSGRVEDEFAQFKDESGPFEVLVQAARKEGMTIGAVKQVVRDEIEHANVNSENRVWVTRVISDALIGLVTKVYLRPEHNLLFEDHDES